MLRGEGPVAGRGPGMTMRGHNITARTCFVGACVRMYNATAGGDHSVVHVAMTASGTASIRARVFGVVAGTRIEPQAYGTIVVLGRAATILVTGAVTVGDFLCMANNLRGAAKTTTTHSGIIFAIASSIKSGSTRGTVTGFILPWRM